MFHLIITDISEVSSNLPISLFAGFIFLLLYMLFKKIKGDSLRKVKIGSTLAGTLFVIYIHMLLYIVYFSRETGSRIGIDLIFFGTWGDTMQAHAWVIENIILFIPLGFLLSFYIKKKKFLVILLGCISSILIEVIQLITGRGFCQLDDVIMNTVGTAIGYIVYIFGRRLFLSCISI